MDLDRWWPLPDAEALREELVAAYGHPDRGYHDLQHLSEVLARIDELVGPEVEDTDVGVLRLAAWFHDAVYDGRPDAEGRSALMAETRLAGVGADPATCAEVGRLVRLTATHRPSRHDHAGQVLSDADLAILAAPPPRYAEYVAGVRREYAHVPDELFTAGRAAVLRDLLARPALFHTDHALRHWEERARGNVGAELRTLES